MACLETSPNVQVYTAPGYDGTTSTPSPTEEKSGHALEDTIVYVYGFTIDLCRARSLPCYFYPDRIRNER
jgi:hypothetical protein